MSETIRLQVTHRELQGEDVLVISLASPEGHNLPAFTAGAHIDLHFGDGMVRQYSLCSSPTDQKAWRLGILKAPESRGGSVAAHRLQIGDQVTVSLPRNLFPLDKTASHTYLFGGGIGVTPMLAMADELHREGHSFELHYCGRTRKRMGFVDEMTQGLYASQVNFHFDDEGEAQRLQLADLLKQAPDNAHVYVCGPEGFMDWVISTALANNIPAGQVHKEYFNKEADASGEAFEVELPEQGITVQVRENQSIANALSEAGVRVKVSCEQGICGTCLANVLEGVPDHRDSYLTDEEKQDNDQIILCCSRSKSKKLVIEVFETE